MGACTLWVGMRIRWIDIGRRGVVHGIGGPVFCRRRPAGGLFAQLVRSVGVVSDVRVVSDIGVVRAGRLQSFGRCFGHRFGLPFGCGFGRRLGCLFGCGFVPWLGPGAVRLLGSGAVRLFGTAGLRVLWRLRIRLVGCVVHALSSIAVA